MTLHPETYRRNYVRGLFIATITLLITNFVFKYDFATESPLISERYISVEVIASHSADSESTRQVANSSTMVTVRLPDGKQAIVPFQFSDPSAGDRVKVKLKLFEDGNQRVVANEI